MMKDRPIGLQGKETPRGRDIFTERREIFKIEECDVEVKDILPRELESETPILFLPGWGETSLTFEDTLRSLVTLGKRRVLAISHDRQGPDYLTEITSEFPAQLHKALTILALIEEKKIPRVDVVAHSEAAINLALAAKLFPEKFRNLILVNPAGLIGEDTFFRISRRFSKSVVADIKQTISGGLTGQRARQANNQRAIYLGSNLPLSFREAQEISKANIEEVIKELKSKNVGVVIVHGVDDPVFPMDRMQPVASIIKPRIDGFYSLRGGHSDLWAHPEEVVSVILDALRNLEKKSLKS